MYTFELPVMILSLQSTASPILAAATPLINTELEPVIVVPGWHPLPGQQWSGQVSPNRCAPIPLTNVSTLAVILLRVGQQPCPVLASPNLAAPVLMHYLWLMPLRKPSQDFWVPRVCLIKLEYLFATRHHTYAVFPLLLN